MRKLIISVFVISMFLLPAHANAAERSFIGKVIDNVDFAIGKVRDTIKYWTSSSYQYAPEEEYTYTSPDSGVNVNTNNEEIIGGRTEPLVYTGTGVPQENAAPLPKDGEVRVQSLEPI